MRRLAILSALLSTAAIAAPPAISTETLKSVTQELASDAYEGRAPATPGEDKTVAYIAKRFAAAGLKPGANGSWYQPVPMVEITTDPKVTLDITGGAQPLSFAYQTEMVLSTRRVQPHVEVRNSEVVFVGYGINAPERGWNDYAGVDVRGKTVVILINDPDWQTKSLDGPFGGRAMTYYGRWTYKYEEAARQGAAAAIIIHDTEPAAYPFTVVRTSWSGPQLNLDSPDGGARESAAIGWVTNDAAHRLFAAAGKDYDTLVAAAAVKGFKAVPMGLKASATLDNSIRRQASRNVVGILPGKTRPGEYVLNSAHWDHLGRCAPVNGDDICNGALDNASGVGGLVALAEAHAKAGAAGRSIVFLAVTGEESGLLGSAWYASHPIYPLRDSVTDLNMDGLSVAGRAKDVVVVGPGKSELEATLATAAQAQGRTVSAEPSPEKGSFYRSDHFSFALKGVPAIYFKPGRDLVDGGTARGNALADDYVAHRYHQPSDQYDPSWDWSGAVEDLQLNYRIGRDLAEGSAWPNWLPIAEFRAARDAIRASK